MKKTTAETAALKEIKGILAGIANAANAESDHAKWEALVVKAWIISGAVETMGAVEALRIIRNTAA